MNLFDLFENDDNNKPQDTRDSLTKTIDKLAARYPTTPVDKLAARYPDKEVKEAKGLGKCVEIIKGPDAGKIGYVRQIKTDRIRNIKYLDLDLKDGGQAVVKSNEVRLVQDLDEWMDSAPGHDANQQGLRPVEEQGVAESSEIKIPTEDGITWQDIRLMAGEGPLTKKTVLQAIAVIRKQHKQRRPQGVAEASTIDGQVQDPKSLVWKQTNMPYDAAVKQFGSKNVRVKRGGLRNGQDFIEVLCPLGEQAVAETVPPQAGVVDPKIQFLQPTIQFAEKLGYRVTLNPQGRVVAKLVNKQLGHIVHIGKFHPSGKGFEVSMADNLDWQTNAWSAKELAQDFKEWYKRAVKDQDFNNGYSEKPQLGEQAVAEAGLGMWGGGNDNKKSKAVSDYEIEHNKQKQAAERARAEERDRAWWKAQDDAAKAGKDSFEFDGKIHSLKEQDVAEHIVKHGSEYRLLSHKGKNLGDFPTHAAAAKHEGEVEYFKHKDDVEEGVVDDISHAVKGVKRWAKGKPSRDQIAKTWAQTADQERFYGRDDSSRDALRRSNRISRVGKNPMAKDAGFRDPNDPSKVLEFAPGNGDRFEPDDRSQLLKTIQQLLAKGAKVDSYLFGARGHIDSVTDDFYGFRFKRKGRPGGAIRPMDGTDDDSYMLKMVKPGYYQLWDKSIADAGEQGVAESAMVKDITHGDHPRAENVPVAQLVNIANAHGALKGREAYVRFSDPRQPPSENDTFVKGKIFDREHNGSGLVYWLKDDTGKNLTAGARDIYVVGQSVEEASMSWAGHKPTGPKFGGYLKGTDPAPTEFDNKGVGGCEESAQPKVPAPRNFVAKNAKMGGAGQHKDAKRAMKNGDVKHKGRELEVEEGIGGNMCVKSTPMNLRTPKVKAPTLPANKHNNALKAAAAKRVAESDIEEGAKVDRMQKHIAKSEKDLGHSKKDAEAIGWATLNKRGYLDNKNKKKHNESINFAQWAMENGYNNFTSNPAIYESAKIEFKKIINEISKEKVEKYYGDVVKKQVDKIGIQPDMYNKLEPKHQRGIDRATARLMNNEDCGPIAPHETYYGAMDEMFGPEWQAVGGALNFAKEHGIPFIAFAAVAAAYGISNAAKTLEQSENKFKQIAAKAIKTVDREVIHKMAIKLHDLSHKTTAVAEDDPCWKGYKQYGMKDKGGKQVPNCVPVEETAAWQKKSGKNKNGGLNKKGVASYRREHPGSKLQTAVTTKPSKLKKGSKAAKRRKSFCARMSGMKGPMKKPNGKPTRKALALRKWHCEGVEHLDAMLHEAMSKKDLLNKLTKDLNSDEFKNAPVDKNKRWEKGDLYTGPGPDDYGYTGYQGHGMPRDKAVKEDESELQPGQYYIWTVYFDDGSSKRIKVTKDNFDPKAYYAKQNKVVINVDYNWEAHTEQVSEDISQRELNHIEQIADTLWNNLGIDVEFTKHFLDRLNDERNGKPITGEELIDLLKKEYEAHGQTIKTMKQPDALMIDLMSQINVPFVVKQKDKKHKELVAATVMRTPNFRSPPTQRKFKVK